jgi:hypothetical protein
LILKTVEAQSHQIEELKTMVSHLLKSAPQHEGRDRAKFKPIVSVYP